METTPIKTIFENCEPIAADFEAQQLKSGHINQTFLVCNAGNRYILQKVNTKVFTRLKATMQNILVVAQHLQDRNYPHHIMKPLAFENNRILAHEQWRIFPFCQNTQTFEKVESAEQTREAAKFLSEFYKYLHDLDTTQIAEALPGFIDFEVRYKQFEKSLESAAVERLEQAHDAIDQITERRVILKIWKNLLPKMPNRLIHADPKISNFLFAKNSSTRIKALIDWDTFMCGPVLYDFGDMVRSYTNLKAEDDPEPGNNFSSENYKALKEGFLHHLTDALLPVEKEHLNLAGQVVVYVQTIRFLTDYLNGDAYFAVHHKNQNLDRAKNQLNLLTELEVYFNAK